MAEADAWSKQILAVAALGAPEHADRLEAAWIALDERLSADTIVYITATDGDDAFLYE